MMGGRIGASRGDLLRLFDGASAAGLDDGELLGRFVARRDEVAFESLVARLGPMVVGVCRRMLRDPHDVDDAFQATFLVLVRRAGSIRDREVVATWLYEVAVRVARRARLDAARRADRERRGAVAEAREAGGDAGADRSEVRAQIDEEIGRLPESHRRLVVLCDVEGLSREEAAARLGWTANMVRGRLERARGRLRDRLTRRGLAPSGAWLALATPGLPPRPALVAATVRCAMGRSTVAGLASASAVSLSVRRDEVAGRRRRSALRRLVGRPHAPDASGDGRPIWTDLAASADQTEAIMPRPYQRTSSRLKSDRQNPTDRWPYSNPTMALPPLRRASAAMSRFTSSSERSWADLKMPSISTSISPIGR